MGVLTEIKEMLGIHPDSGDAFDAELIVHINAALSTMHQNGVSDKPIVLVGDGLDWEDFLDERIVGYAKQYVYLKVRTIFDTSTTASYVIECMNKQADEMLWRIREEIEGDENE